MIFVRLTLSLILASFVALSACGPSSGREVAQWAAEVRAAQERVSVAEQAGDDDRAEQELRLLATDAHLSVDPELVRPVRQDAYYQLVRLALRQERPEIARDYADEGLSLGRGSAQAPNVLAASLLVARGQAQEALGNAHDAASDYHEALMINERLLDRALEEDTP